MKAIGKNPDYTGKKFKIPIIRLRRKLFAEGLAKYGNAEKAQDYCIRKSINDNQNPYLCKSAYDMYKTLYSTSPVRNDNKINASSLSATSGSSERRNREIAERFETKKHHRHEKT